MRPRYIVTVVSLGDAGLAARPERARRHLAEALAEKLNAEHRRRHEPDPCD